MNGESFFYKYAFPLLMALLIDRFEPDMLAFSGCYYGGGDKERYELGEIRKRWATLPVRFLSSWTFDLNFFPSLFILTK